MSQPNPFVNQGPVPPTGVNDPSARLPGPDPTPVQAGEPSYPPPAGAPISGQPADSAPYPTQPVDAAYPPPAADPAYPSPAAQVPDPTQYAPQPPHPPDPARYPGQSPYPADPAQYAAQPPYPSDAPAYPADPAQYAAQPPYPSDAPAYPGPAMFAPAYAGQAYAGAPPTAPPKKRKLWLIPLIIALVLVLGGGGFAAWWFLIRVDPVTGPVTPGQARSPQAAVRGYLEALQADQISDALMYAQTPPRNQPFLTADVLTQAQAGGGISNIAVTKDAGSTKTTATVAATYNLNGQTVSASYDVVLVDKHWFLTEVVAWVDLSDDLPWSHLTGLSLNGASLDNVDLAALALFPGTYTIELTNDLVAMSGDSQFTLTDLQAEPEPLDLALNLTDAAQSLLQQAAQASLDDCMREQDLGTTCGFGFGTLEGGATADLSTVVWSYESGSSSDFSGATFSLTDPSDPTSAEASIDVWVDIRVRDTGGGRYGDTIHLTRVEVDFSNTTDLWVSFAGS